MFPQGIMISGSILHRTLTQEVKFLKVKNQ